LKTYSNKKMRRHQKELIHRADWDSWNDFPSFYYEDPWAWD
jgi:hypothetical protein